MKEANDLLRIDLGELLTSLSLALDIAENRYYEHSRRVAYISINIAKEMGLSNVKIKDTYYASLIHDIGMAGQMASYSIEDIHYGKKLKRDHCKLGFEIVKNLPLNKDICKYILLHHEEWNGSGVFGISGNDIPLTSQIIHIADYFDLIFSGMYKDINSDEKMVKWVENSKNTYFNPEIADILLCLMEREKFWFDLRYHDLSQILSFISPAEKTIIDISQLKKIAKAFSMIIDSKSKFTHDHSKGIAKLTRNMANYIGYDDLSVEKLEIAANLHDLGKLVVPNYILEKPGKLSNSEFKIIKSHPYYTKLILKQVKGIEEIAEWAGNHHEKLNGNGYPERLDFNQLTKEDQIIAVADIYQALTENRPYRDGMSHQKAMMILNDMGKNGYLSKSIIKVIDEVAGQK